MNNKISLDTIKKMFNKGKKLNLVIKYGDDGLIIECDNIKELAFMVSLCLGTTLENATYSIKL